jgi:hypothetical protein
VALVLLIALVIALLGALAQLALDYPVDSGRLVDGDARFPEATWFARSGGAR